MKNLLYVSIVENVGVTGGSLGRKSNYSALQACKINLKEYRIPLKNNFIKILASLLNYKAGLSRRHIKKILSLIYTESIDFLFLDTSLYGQLAKVVQKKTSVKIITFFHNCEYDIYAQSIKNRPLFRLLLNSVAVNEYYSMKYSAVCVFLTDRDYSRCKEQYKIDCKHFFTPISLSDVYHFNGRIERRIPQRLLFVGSYFFPNVNGLIWFVNKVLPHIHYSLTIVGKGFEQAEFLSKLKNSSNVNIKGFVEDLSAEYENSDIVVQPVFEGSGMKTKTAECFMYGKPIVSASEGLIGYQDSIDGVFRCDTEQAFINILNDLQKTGVLSYYQNLKTIFKEYYSLDARIKNYKHLLNGLENE